MYKLRVGDVVRLPMGGIGQITKMYPNGRVFVKSFEFASETYNLERLKLYIPDELEARLLELEFAIKRLEKVS